MIRQSAEAINQSFNGPAVSIKSQDGPGQAPGCGAGRRRAPKPIESGRDWVIPLFSAQGKQGDGRCVQMWRQRNPVNYTIPGIPAPAGTSAIEQHLLATADSEADPVWLAANECLLQCDH